MAKWDAIDNIRESDEENNYIKKEKLWEKVVEANKEQILFDRFISL
jgi:hypothetical protein